MTRRTLDNENPNGLMPEQKIIVEQALRAYTVDAAYASFEENIKGTLEQGKIADLSSRTRIFSLANQIPWGRQKCQDGPTWKDSI